MRDDDIEQILKKSLEGTPTPQIIDIMTKATDPANIYVDRDSFYASDLIRKMMVTDPSFRISMREVLKHRFLQLPGQHDM